MKVTIGARRDLSQDAHFAVMGNQRETWEQASKRNHSLMDLVSLIETIQLDDMTADALDSYLRHAIAIPLESHVGFGTGSD